MKYSYAFHFGATCGIKSRELQHFGAYKGAASWYQKQILAKVQQVGIKQKTSTWRWNSVNGRGGDQEGRGVRGRSLTLQRPLGINSGGLSLVLTRRRKYLHIPRTGCGWIQVPCPRPLFGELFFAAGPSHREPGDGMSGGIEPTSTPSLQPINLRQPPEQSSLKQLLGRFLVLGRGVPSNILGLLAYWPRASWPKPSKGS